MSRRKPTQEDVAKAAEVSQALVSLVLSEAAAPVAEVTRTRILEAAQKLGYSSRKGRTAVRRQKLLAYIRPRVERGHHEKHWIYDSYEQFYNQIQNRLVEKTYASGYPLIVRPYTDPIELTHWLIEWGVDGVFLHSSDESLAQWICSRYPMVQINRRPRLETNSVLPNQEEIVLLAMNHLREHGHERIALVLTGADGYVLQQRQHTYVEYTRQQGLPCYEEWFSEASLEKIVGMLAERSKTGPTALIIGDHGALLIQQELLRLGFSLPEDLSMVGIDNISASNFSSPPLSSIDVRLDEVSDVALALMTARIQNPAGAFQKIEVSPKLVVRRSVSTISKTPKSRPKSSIPE